MIEKINQLLELGFSPSFIEKILQNDLDDVEKKPTDEQKKTKPQDNEKNSDKEKKPTDDQEQTKPQDNEKKYSLTEEDLIKLFNNVMAKKQEMNMRNSVYKDTANTDEFDDIQNALLGIKGEK